MTTTAQIPQGVGFNPTSGQVKRVVRLNIGLNNNPYSADEVVKTVKMFADVDSTMIVNGEYNGDVEPTVVVVGLTTHSHGVVGEFVKALCRVLTQECIPFRLGGKGELVYHPNYEGDRYDFYEQYFIS